MKIEKKTLGESADIYKEWVYNTFPTLGSDYEVELDTEYLEMRELSLSKYLELKSCPDNQKYDIDYKFSIWFYNYISQKEWFNLRLASNEDFWRYIAMVVMPDLIADRFKSKSRLRFYSKGTRIYPYTLFWYTYLSLQDGDLSITEKLLSSKRFTTDTIVGLVERTGSNGTYIDLYRQIMLYFGSFKAPENAKFITLFRSVMKLCMSNITVIDPDLYKDGAKGFAKNLVDTCSSQIDFNQIREDQLEYND